MSANISRRFLASAGALLVSAGSVPGAGECRSDAELIRLCGEYVEADDRHQAACASQAAFPKPLTQADAAEWHRLDDIACEAGVVLGRLEDELPQMHALTIAGARAKAEVTLRVLRHVKADHGGSLARSLAADVLGKLHTAEAVS